MPVQIGEPIGFCECGCGGIVYERIYIYGGSITKRRPTKLRGHHKKSSSWERCQDVEPVEPVWEAVQRFKSRFGLKWVEVTEITGYGSQIQDIRYRKFIRKHRAEKIFTEMRAYARLHKGVRHQ